MILQFLSFSELKSMKQHREPTKVLFRVNEMPKIFTANTFSCVLGRLSSCDHLDLEKSPSVRETNGRATGSRYTGRSDNLQTFASKLQLSQVLRFHPTVYPPVLALGFSDCTLKLSMTTWSLFFSVSLSLSLSLFLSLVSIQFALTNRGLPGENPTISMSVLTETLLYPCGFFLFPVCSLYQGVVHNFLSKQSQRATATRPQCLLHTDLILQLPKDLLYCYYSLACFFPPLFYNMKGCCVLSVLFLLFKHCVCEWKQGKCITSLLSATMISSTYLVVCCVCLLCWGKKRGVAC